ncbi:MAG: flagellar hook-basal body complex protein FliE [Lachnospiraceae bacterium]
MNIYSLYSAGVGASDTRQNITAIKQLTEENGSDSHALFSNMLGSAMESINTTNGYLSDAENEEIKLALGETENAHDLTIALSKASTALQYTVAIRDKFMEAYKEIMQMNI